MQSLAHPSPSRRSCLLISHHGDAFFVFSNALTSVVVRVCPFTSTLLYRGIIADDVFCSHGEARDNILKTLFCSSLNTDLPFECVLGLRVFQSYAAVLLATSTKTNLLPGNVVAETVESSVWVKIPSRRVCVQSQIEDDDRTFDVLKQHPIDRFNFFSAQIDLTRPHPSAFAVDDYELSFCWNHSLRTAFVVAGLSFLCPPLLCGAVYSCVPHAMSPPPQSSSSSSAAAAAASPSMSLAVIARKLSTHPGTRFEARGVDANGHAGNEVEVELICWKQPQDDGVPSHDAALPHWRSVVWRRGSAPIKWRAQIRGVGDPCFVIGDGDGSGAHVGTDIYFGNLKARFGNVGIYCISLLRSEGEEANVLHAYRDAAAKESVNVINFDWHDQMKSLGQHAAVARLWEIVGPLLRDHGFNAGVGSSTINPATKQQQQQQQQQQSPPFSPKSPLRDRRTSTSSAVYLHSPASSQDKELGRCSMFSSPAVGSFASPRFKAVRKKERGFRLSDDDTDDDDDGAAADDDDCGNDDGNSVDERGLTRGFGGIFHKTFDAVSSDESFDLSKDYDNVSPAHAMHQQQQLLLRFSCADSLDRTNLASFFVALQFVGEAMRELAVPYAVVPPASRATNRTSSVHEDIHHSVEWPLLHASLDTCLRCIGASTCDALVQAFLAIGDTLSLLYTDSNALDTAFLRSLSTRDVGAAEFNLFISIQRRVANVYNDASRSAAIKAFIGNTPQLLPASASSDDNYVWMSAPPSSLVHGIDTGDKVQRDTQQHMLLSARVLNMISGSGGVSVSDDTASVTVTFSLPHVARPTQLAMMLHPDATFGRAVTFDVFIGSQIDTMVPVLKAVELPDVHHETTVFYSLEHASSHSPSVITASLPGPFGQHPPRFASVVFNSLQAISAGLVVVPFAVPGLAVLGLPHEDVIITPAVLRHVQQHHISQQQQTETRNKLPGQAADQDSSACFHSETVSVFAARCSPPETAIKSNIFDSRFLTACNSCFGPPSGTQFVSSRFYSPYTASQPASSASPHSPAVSKSSAKASRVAAQFNSNDHAVDVGVTAAAVASLSRSSADADDELAAAAVESRASDTGEHCNPDGPDFSDLFQLRFVSEVAVSSSQPPSPHVSLAAAQDASSSPVPPRSPASFFSNVPSARSSPLVSGQGVAFAGGVFGISKEQRDYASTAASVAAAAAAACESAVGALSSSKSPARIANQTADIDAFLALEELRLQLGLTIEERRVCLMNIRNGSSLVSFSDTVQWRNILGHPPRPRLSALGDSICKRLQATSRAVDSAHFDRWWRSTLRASAVFRSRQSPASVVKLAASISDASRTLGGLHGLILSAPVAAPHSPPAELLLWPGVCMITPWQSYPGVRTSRFVIQLPYASIVESIHVVSIDACLAVSCLETGVTCDDLHSCVFEVGVEQRMRKIDVGRDDQRQQQQQQRSHIDLTSSQSDSVFLYTITPHQAKRSQVIAITLVSRSKCVSVSRVRFSGVVIQPHHESHDDDFVTDMHGIPSYGDAVKEKTFAIGNSSSSSAHGGFSGLKVSDFSLDRHVVFQNFCSLSAIQLEVLHGFDKKYQVRELRVVPQGAVSALAAAIKVLDTNSSSASGNGSPDEFCLVVPSCPTGSVLTWPLHRTNCSSVLLQVASSYGDDGASGGKVSLFMYR